MAEASVERGWRGRISVRRWFAALSVYREPRLVAILLMGFSSGLPLALTGATLSLRLADIGVSLTAIGLFTLVRFSYSFKFLWAPVIDRLPLPGITTRLGRRRGWALMIQAALALAILWLGFTDPLVDPVDDRARRDRRRVPVGQPGHRHRRLSHRAADPRGAGRRRRRDAMGLPLRHDRRRAPVRFTRRASAAGVSPTR